MIYDCFSFFNELDILEIRLNVLDPVVDKFVLVEAVRRHSGEPKELFFQKNRERFAKFLPKIVHVVVSDEPHIPSDCPRLIAAWAYENHQRNAIVRGLVNIQDDDVLLISDLDEIPDPRQVLLHADDEGVTGFDLLPFYYYLNYVCVNNPHWRGTKMLKWKTFKDPSTYLGMASHIPMPEFVNVGPTATRVRFCNDDRKIRAGWHFSYYGGAEQILLKLKSIADNVCDKSVDVSLDIIKARIARGEDPMGRGGFFYAVPLDGRYPNYIRENKERYADGIIPCVGISMKNRMLGVMARARTIVVDFVAAHMPDFIRPLAYSVYRRVVKNPIPLMKDQLSQKRDKEPGNGAL